jgi:hypothetical protein
VAGTVTLDKLWSVAGVITIIVVTAAVGLVVASHQPRNPIGWLLACESAFMLLVIAAGAYADRTIASFAGRPKDAVDLESVETDLTRVVYRALEPTHVSVWTSRRPH